MVKGVFLPFIARLALLSELTTVSPLNLSVFLGHSRSLSDVVTYNTALHAAVQGGEESYNGKAKIPNGSVFFPPWQRMVCLFVCSVVVCLVGWLVVCSVRRKPTPKSKEQKRNTTNMMLNSHLS